MAIDLKTLIDQSCESGDTGLAVDEDADWMPARNRLLEARDAHKEAMSDIAHKIVLCDPEGEIREWRDAYMAHFQSWRILNEVMDLLD